MNIKRLINETIIASNGDMSRGLKNQLSIFSAFTSEDLEQKMNFLKQAGIPVHSYFGIRILEFKLSDINAVINANQAKLANYKNNPQSVNKLSTGYPHLLLRWVDLFYKYIDDCTNIILVFREIFFDF